MRAKTLDIDLADVDANGIYEAAAIGADGIVSMDGALVVGGVAVMDFARRIYIDSAGNDSGDTMTVVGTDENGLPLSEDITMGNTTGVTTTGYFKTISSMTSSGASAGNVTIGTVDEAIVVIPTDQRSDSACNIFADITGTINYTIAETFANFSGNTAAETQAIAYSAITAFSAKTADVKGAATVGASAVRFVVNSYTNGAEVQLYYSQPLNC